MSHEKDHMLAGEPYDPGDPELTADRARARRLCLEYAAIPHDDESARHRLMDELLGSHRGVNIQAPFFCDYGYNIRCGEDVYFNFNCVVLDVCTVRIGSHTMFGPAVQIYAANHPEDHLERRGKESGKPVVIGDDVWVGGGAIICPGVTIGDRAIIGAGSVVVRDIPPDVFAAGNPCRVIRALETGKG